MPTHPILRSPSTSGTVQRREIALEPYALMRDVTRVFSPFLDHDVYDLLSSLPPSTVARELKSPDKSFHSDAIARGYPQFADLPFEDKNARKLSSREHYRVFNRATARYLLKTQRTPFRIISSAFVWPRLLLSLGSHGYAESTTWLPSLAILLSQLEQAPDLARRHLPAVSG